MALFGDEVEKGMWAAPKVRARPEHIEHSKQWADSPRIINVCDGIYVAFGYGIANSICLEMDDSIVIVDVILNATRGEMICKEFKKRCKNKPISVIILTHFHGDHVFGMMGFLKCEANEGKDVKIYLHEEAMPCMQRTLTQVYAAMGPRNLRQFGALQKSNLSEKLLRAKGWHWHSGIGPALDVGLNPNKTASGERQSESTFVPFDRLTLINQDTFLNQFTWKGQRQTVEILCAPGETDDQVIVYIPERKVMCPADDFYYAFPNLYAIRGTVGRNCQKWVHSLDRMRLVNAQRGIEYMVGSHSLPEYGSAHIEKELVLYRDTIQFVHDQTLRAMNMGERDQDKVVETVESLLPKRMTKGRVQQFYGTLEWSVRSVYSQYLGWFQGTSDRLYPASREARGSRLLELFKHVDFQAQFSRGRDAKMENSFERIVLVVLGKCKEMLASLRRRVGDGYDSMTVAYEEERFVLELVTWLALGFDRDQGRDLVEIKKLKKMIKKMEKRGKEGEDDADRCVKKLRGLEKTYASRAKCQESLNQMKWQVMRDIAEKCYSGNGRNWLIQEWLIEQFDIRYIGSPLSGNVFGLLPINWFIETMSMWIDPLSCDETVWNFRVLILFTDWPDAFELLARDGILEIISHDKKNDAKWESSTLPRLMADSAIVFKLTCADWKLKKQNDFVIKGAEEDVIKFWSLFEFPEIGGDAERDEGGSEEFKVDKGIKSKL